VVKAAARECMICHAAKIIHVKNCPNKILSITNLNFQTITSFTTYKELKSINHILRFNIIYSTISRTMGIQERTKNAQWIKSPLILKKEMTITKCH
jgi:hypothetical protein